MGDEHCCEAPSELWTLNPLGHLSINLTRESTSVEPVTSHMRETAVLNIGTRNRRHGPATHSWYQVHTTCDSIAALSFFFSFLVVGLFGCR